MENNLEILSLLKIKSKYIFIDYCKHCIEATMIFSSTHNFVFKYTRKGIVISVRLMNKSEQRIDIPLYPWFLDN